MCGNSNNGFTLLELIIVIAIIALLGTVVVPNLRSKDPKKERKEFVARLNNLMTFAWYNGITTGKVQRVVFDLSKQLVYLEQQKNLLERPGQEPEYEPIKRAYNETSLTWPKHYLIKNFLLEGYDEATRHGGGLKMTWFFIVPDGLTQDVKINALDMSDKEHARKGIPFSIVLNPFSAQFKEYGQFQTIA